MRGAVARAEGAVDDGAEVGGAEVGGPVGQRRAVRPLRARLFPALPFPVLLLGSLTLRPLPLGGREVTVQVRAPPKESVTAPPAASQAADGAGRATAFAAGATGTGTAEAAADAVAHRSGRRMPKGKFLRFVR